VLKNIYNEVGVVDFDFYKAAKFKSHQTQYTTSNEKCLAIHLQTGVKRRGKATQWEAWTFPNLFPDILLPPK